MDQTLSTKPPKRRLKKKQKDMIFYILMLAFPVTQFLIFYVGVNFNSILLAFRKYDVLKGEFSWAGFDNFIQVFSDFRNLAIFEISFKKFIDRVCIWTDIWDFIWVNILLLYL